MVSAGARAAPGSNGRVRGRGPGGKRQCIHVATISTAFRSPSPVPATPPISRPVGADDLTTDADLERLAAIIDASPLPREEEVDAGRISVPAVLAHLAASWRYGPSALENEWLDALCRKIDVAGRVWATYELGWRKPAEAQVLPEPLRRLLIALLLAYARPTADGDDDARGRCLKRINSALKAIDGLALADEPAVGNELGTIAASLLRRALVR